MALVRVRQPNWMDLHDVPAQPLGKEVPRATTRRRHPLAHAGADPVVRLNSALKWTVAWGLVAIASRAF